MPHNNSLFERLDFDASTQVCSKTSVAAHLGKMLSTRAGSVQTLPDYGLPDLNDMRLSLHESLSQSRLLIERFIRAYEPRLANVRVRVLPRVGESLTLAFAIEAALMVGGVMQPVVFHARLADAGRVEVCVDGL
ncbi:type VI secretion system baseplate subunit TssE [Pseudomonas antarctica]|uniref:Gene 25-like lysozyme n=1 Tax=Pseudomonas antarctica TaxID=219572 RepID=A0A1H0A2D2_9PSED|nr:type VI secretion system baseplate subunit TssE [Pseudomonas antarctica]KAF2407060.1 gene 25-like lysozyme [Pseudomonas antarctica]SDN27361.1 type VI secretion system protein [Pseudomonas antarctica]